MNEKHYYVCKKKNHKEIIYLDYNKLSGFDFKPKNNIKDCIEVNKMVIIKPSMIEKILRKKIKKKLELYLKMIMMLIEDDSSSSTLEEALNDITRFKSIIRNKYLKYLEDRYIEILNKKISILEYELNLKLSNIKVSEKTTSRRR